MIVAEEPIGPFAGIEYGVELWPFGDADGDGDDEVLLRLQHYGAILRILDAEPATDGLGLKYDTFGAIDALFLDAFVPSFDVAVGDFDADGKSDVAFSLTWSDDEITDEGAMAFWFGSSLRGAGGPEVRFADDEQIDAGTTGGPESCGCGTTSLLGASGGLLVLWFASVPRAGPRRHAVGVTP